MSDLLLPSLKFFSDGSHPTLARSFAERLSYPLLQVENAPFPDGEPNVVLSEGIQGKGCILFHSSVPPVSQSGWDLLWKIEALKRLEASSILLIAPYLGLGRQEGHPEKPGPFYAFLSLLYTLGVEKILTLNCHSVDASSFLMNLSALPLLTQVIEFLGKKNLVVCPVDKGVLHRQGPELLTLHLPLYPLEKTRLGPRDVQFFPVAQEVEGKRCLLVDDIFSTGHSISGAARCIKEAGAAEIYAFCTHGVCVSGSEQVLNQAPLDGLFLTDSLPLPPEILHHPTVSLLPITSLLEQAFITISNQIR